MSIMVENAMDDYDNADESFDMASELEKLGEMLGLTDSDW